MGSLIPFMDAGRTIGVTLDLMREAGRMVASGLKRKLGGIHPYPGDAKAICRSIVERCFRPDKGYFQTSLTTYTGFWARDFGRCVPSLIALGYREEVLSTYRYALGIYERANRFALAITPRGNLFDFPYYAPDGFAFFLKGLAHLDAPALLTRYRSLLERELARFADLVIDPKNGRVRADRHFSEAQDYAKRTSSCYSTAMCHVVQEAARALELDNPLLPFDYKTIIHTDFWNGDHFHDDVMRQAYVSGDACIAPFWAGAVYDPETTFPKVLARMDAEGLTKPYPARYGNTVKKNRPMIRLERLNPWQRDTVWTCLGLQLLEVLERLDPPRYRLELSRYAALVETLGCFPEVLSPDNGALFKGPLYMSDNAMLWAADLLRMLSERDARSPN